MTTIRLRLARLFCPSSHRLIEVDDVVTCADMAESDLIRGGDALSKGWGCDPAILYNAAAILRARRNPTTTHRQRGNIDEVTA